RGGPRRGRRRVARGTRCRVRRDADNDDAHDRRVTADLRAGDDDDPTAPHTAELRADHIRAAGQGAARLPAAPFGTAQLDASAAAGDAGVLAPDERGAPVAAADAGRAAEPARRADRTRSRDA